MTTVARSVMILVDDAAEDSSSPHRFVHRDHHARFVVGRTLIQTLVWTVPVEVPA
jgi:hypothetical protein